MAGSSISTGARRLVRGRVLQFLDDPMLAGDRAVRLIEDGALLVDRGRIGAVGPALDLMAAAPGVPVDDYGTALIVPGFIDTHIHAGQTQIIASYGEQLLEWLEKYTFPAELRFADPDHCARVARWFFDALFRHGTTTAVIYATVHKGSAEALFAVAERYRARMVAGKVLMDRNAPAGLQDTVQSGYDDSAALIDRWHGSGRLSYAVTPRFAITSTEAQLEAAAALMATESGLVLQTHLSENRSEIAAVARLFPNATDYTDVYERAGLLGARSLFGHCLHLSQRERRRLSETGSVAVFCPTSNLFVGSGLYDRAGLVGGDHPVRQALATDVGGGTSYSMLETAGEAYKVLQLQGQRLPALEAFHQMTRGNAQALGMADLIGTLEPGTEADFVVLDSRATPAMEHRMATAETLEEELFVLITLGDDRAILATYVDGHPVWRRETAPQTA